jgi:flavin-dependent dehydrogenase
VQRATFDKLLADEAAKQGVEVLYQEEILGADFAGELPKLSVRNKAGELRALTARFVLDASGYGRTLPKLLKLETPSHLPARRAYFTHIKDNILPGDFDRQKIRVTVNPKQNDVWYWLIPFSNGRASVGVVGLDSAFSHLPPSPAERLKGMNAEDPRLAALLRHAEYDSEINELAGYSANVTAMSGKGFALLGNAAEFLDPVFSSGVTIAMKSASMAAKVLGRQLKGETVDWHSEFDVPLRKGIDAFKTYVNGWYDGRFQAILFHPYQAPEIKAMICSVLAGYAWDASNPFAAQSESRFNSLYELCRPR